MSASPDIVPAEVARAAEADAVTAAPWSPGAPAPAAGAAPGAAPPAPAGPDYPAEARDLVETVYALILPLYPSLAPIYTPDVRARIAATWAPVAQKYNLTLGALGPELVFAATVLPLIAPTVQAIRTDRAAAQKAKPAADAPADAAAPAAPVVDDAPFKNYVPIVAPVQLAA